ELSCAVLGPHPRREIPGDLAEAAEVSRGVPEGGDDDVRPEPRAVLAHAPTFVLDPTELERELELAPRFARGDFLRRVEGRDVLPDHLARGVALDALRTDVPRGDAALRIEHENRVVDDTLDEQSTVVPSQSLNAACQAECARAHRFLIRGAQDSCMDQYSIPSVPRRKNSLRRRESP